MTGHFTRTNPADFLNAIVAGNDTVTDLQFFDPTLAFGRRDQGTRCKAGNDLFDIGKVQPAGFGA